MDGRVYWKVCSENESTAIVAPITKHQASFRTPNDYDTEMLSHTISLRLSDLAAQESL
jgi:hypothetical protein